MHAHLLPRNPAVVAMPMIAKEAADHCRAYRLHPRWRLVENAPVMEAVWKHASARHFARRRIFELRLALTLQHHGVTEFDTMNVRDFEELRFRGVWNPVKV